MLVVNKVDTSILHVRAYFELKNQLRTPSGLTENHIDQFKEETTQMVKMPRAKNFLHAAERLRIPHSNQENGAKFR